jgi:hypothetical protein
VGTDSVEGAVQARYSAPLRSDAKGKGGRDVVDQATEQGSNGTAAAATKDPAGTPPTAAAPTPASKPVEGKVETGEKFGGISELVAYSSLEDAAKKVAPEVIKRVKPGAVVVIAHDPNAFGSNTAYEQLTKGFDAFEKSFSNASTGLKETSPLVDGAEPRRVEDLLRDVERVEFLIAPAAIGPVLVAGTKLVPIAAKAVSSVIGGLPAATAAIASLADLIGMFKVNAVVRSPEITVSVEALSALVAGRLVNPNDGKVLHVSLAGLDIFEDSPMLSRFVELAGARAELEDTIREVVFRDITARERKVDALTKSLLRIDEKRETAIAEGKASATDLEQLADKLTADLVAIETEAYAQRRADVEAARALIKSWDDFVAVITTPPASSAAAAPLALAAGAERLRSVTIDGQRRDVTNVLFVSVSSAKGEAATKQGNFIMGPEGGFTGGTYVTWLLLDKSGSIQASGATGHLRFVGYDIDDGKIKKRASADLTGA